jgi:hypothetical protein
MRLYVSVCVSFNCNAFLAKICIWNRSSVFNLSPLNAENVIIRGCKWNEAVTKNVNSKKKKVTLCDY